MACYTVDDHRLTMGVRSWAGDCGCDLPWGFRQSMRSLGQHRCQERGGGLTSSGYGAAA